MRRPDIIPVQWVTDHRPVAAASMTLATCQIRQQDTKTTDRTTGRTVIVKGATVVGSSPCRLQRNDVGQRNQTATQTVVTSAYLLGLPITDAAITPGMVVEILASTDTRLAGRTFSVQTEIVGTTLWERDLYVVDNESRG